MATPKHTGGIDLEGAVELWQTPNVPNGGRVNPPTMSDTGIMPDGSKRQVGLEDQVRRLERVQWVTPATRDWKGANSGAHVTELGGGRRHMDQLSNQVEHSFRPDHPTETHGEASSQKDQTSHPPSTPKRLNPKFVEWLQGLPEGWTSAGKINSEALATWSALSRELLRSLFSSIER